MKDETVDERAARLTREFMRAGMARRQIERALGEATAMERAVESAMVDALQAQARAGERMP